MIRSLAVTLAILALGASARAEIAVETSASGAYKGFHANSRVENGRVLHWTPKSFEAGFQYLNANGDLNGDLKPAWVLLPGPTPDASPTPLVVWPRNDGRDLELSWARWLPQTGWEVPTDIRLSNTVDDVGVSLFLDPRGDAHLAWWANQSPPVVLYQKFARGIWSTTEKISPDGRDARNPQLLFGPDWALYVLYENWTTTPLRIESFLKERFDP